MVITHDSSQTPKKSRKPSRNYWNNTNPSISVQIVQLIRRMKECIDFYTHFNLLKLRRHIYSNSKPIALFILLHNEQKFANWICLQGTLTQKSNTASSIVNFWPLYGPYNILIPIFERKLLIILLITDHTPLTWLFLIKEPGSLLARWHPKSEEYHYEICYKLRKV